MAKAISSEELQLKKRARRRLVGAIALVLMVVVFLPMILDNEPRQISENVAIRIPPSPQEDGTANETTSDSEPLRFRPVEQGLPADEAVTAEAVDAGEMRQEPEPVAVKPEPVATDKPDVRPTPSKGGFVIQLGAFSDAGNAARLVAKVRENRFDAYTEVVTTSGGKRTRVRVGPYSTKAEAEQARDRLKARKLTYGEPAIMRSDN